MAGRPWDVNGDARRALAAIVTDPHYGAAVLSKPAVVSNLLKDLLPDQPREVGLLVAAAHADLAGTLSRHLEQGVDPRTAARLTASSFAESTSHTADACAWVVGEFALALGLGKPVLASIGESVPAFAAASRPDTTLRPGPADTEPEAPAPTPAVQPRTAQLSAVLTAAAAAYFLLLACLAPYALDGSSPISLFGGGPDDSAGGVFWFALEPAGVLLIAIGSFTVLIARRLPRFGWLLPGILLGIAVQTVLLFASHWFPATRHGVGGLLGVLAAAGLFATGLRVLAPPESAETRRRYVVALAVAGVGAIIASVLWLSGAAPDFLDAGSAAPLGGRHAWRGVAAAVGGAGAIAGAWILSRWPVPRVIGNRT